jgi:hypothetical protein
MAYGISIANAAGTTIISEEYSNYMVVSAGTSVNGTYGWTVSGDDILWVRPHILSGNYLHFDPTNTSPVLHSTSGTIEWVVTRRNPAPSSDTFGLRVLRADGSVAFDSGRAPLTPVMTFRDTANEASAANNAVYQTNIVTPFSAPAGRKRFVPFDCFEDFISWQLVGAAAYKAGSLVVWTDEDHLTFGAEQRFINSSYAAVGYNKPVGHLNYFVAEFAV